MTYLIKDTSVQDGQPVELFTFIQGLQTWRYCNQAASVIVAGLTYTASAITRSELSTTGEMSKDGLSLSFPRDHEFASQYLGPVSDLITTVTLQRGHTTDGDLEYITYWKGRVLTAKIGRSEITLECESVFSSLRRPGLRARYTRTCRHSLYGAGGCRADKATFAVAGVPTALSGTALTVPEAATKPDGWFVGGMVEIVSGGALRFVVGHVGQNLTLSRPFEALAALLPGTPAVKLYPGCDHAKTTCNTKFNNLPNYGGFPYIPIRNPLDGGSIV